MRLRCRTKRLVILALGGSLALGDASPVAAVARQVKDIGAVPHSVGEPLCDRIETLGSVAMFLADDGTTGFELFRTGGVPATTSLVREVALGRQESGGADGLLGTANGRVVFVGSRPESGVSIWASDGTPGGTTMLIDLSADDPTLRLAWSESIAGQVLFATYRDESSTAPFRSQLWRTDGTVAGTQRLLDSSTADVAVDTFTLPAVKGDLFFVARVPTGSALWRTDGTPVGTVEVLPFGSEGGPGQPFPLGDRIAFLGGRTDSGTWTFGLWIVDPDGGALELVRAFDEPVDSWAVVSTGERLYFVASEPPSGEELWVSDGTVQGTVLPAEVVPGPASASIASLTAADGRVFFRAFRSDLGFEPWTSDGSPGGTVLLGDLRPGPAGSMEELCCSLGDAAAGGNAYFVPTGAGALLRVDDGVHGVEPWWSDGTANGTELVADLSPGSQGSQVEGCGRYAGDAVFRAAPAGASPELWASDGTTAGTRRITSVGRTVASGSVADLSTGNEQVWFSASDSIVESPRPWRSDGTAPGTIELAGAIAPEYDVVAETVPLDSGLVVGLSPSRYGDGSLLWSSEGTTLSTLGIFSEECGGGPGGTTYCVVDELARAGDRAVFPWLIGVDGMELWATDGTVANTAPVEDLNPTGWGSPAALVEWGNDALFFATNGQDGVEPWITDGTVAGTSMLADSVPGPEGVGSARRAYLLDESAGSLFFETISFSEHWLKYYDGQGSPPVELLRVDLGSLEVLGRAGDRLVFAATEDKDPGVGRELWASDGTASGTRLVRDLRSGPESSGIGHGAELGGLVYFAACDRVAGCELWRTDGTTAGTERVLDLAPGLASSYPSELASFAERLYFRACQEATGCEPWISDGTAAGTHRAADISAGRRSSMGVAPASRQYPPAEGFVRLGDEVFFPADDGSGTELWAVPIEIFYDGFETGDESRWSLFEPLGD